MNRLMGEGKKLGFVDENGMAEICWVGLVRRVKG